MLDMRHLVAVVVVLHETGDRCQGVSAQVADARAKGMAVCLLPDGHTRNTARPLAGRVANDGGEGHCAVVVVRVLHDRQAVLGKHRAHRFDDRREGGVAGSVVRVLAVLVGPTEHRLCLCQCFVQLVDLIRLLKHCVLAWVYWSSDQWLTTARRVAEACVRLPMADSPSWLCRVSPSMKYRVTPPLRNRWNP